ncbi:nucleoside diphosphate kinase regulator [Arenibaculum pallidiluteum]|uniref:nucleoside diphosphate kinase regulator n=1 Tax=Arenibaculum pallidiluteum TaxID=2812559 RepID=UPI001A97ACAC|nr:nucleoside diphosphate kinase regulator [Arenibaculum pallidiluteum]
MQNAATRQVSPASAGGQAKPRIRITAEDNERLSTLARAAMDIMPDIASCLVDELDRAQVLPAGRIPDDVVRMGSLVRFRDETTGTVRTATLVYPDEADIERGRVSVLTPIGTALIGLGVGQSILWETRTGDERRLTVLDVQRGEPG